MIYNYKLFLEYLFFFPPLLFIPFPVCWDWVNGRQKRKKKEKVKSLQLGGFERKISRVGNRGWKIGSGSRSDLRWPREPTDEQLIN